MIPGNILDRVAEVYKATGSGGSHSYGASPAFEWPCRMQPEKPAAQAQVTGRFVYSTWLVFGNVPTEGDIEAGDKLILDDGTDLRVTSVAIRTSRRGNYLALTATRS